MANPEHVEILRQGRGEWNLWRINNPEVLPDLTGADLTGIDLGHPASNVTASSPEQEEEIRKLSLMGVNLRNACLQDAILFEANLTIADLSGADLSNARLGRAIFTGADLNNANLSSAILVETLFLYTNLENTDFDKAVLAFTLFANVNLRHAKNLGRCDHLVDSALDYRTLQKSWPLPNTFLRGVGLPEEYIKNLGILLKKSPQFCSVFISYSHKDNEFVQQLYDSLQARGVPCLKDQEDLPFGENIRHYTNRLIEAQDKLLLVLSEDSIKSEWVRGEVEWTLEKERESGKFAIVPIKIDEACEKTKVTWMDELHQRNIGDFTGWKDHDKYKRALESLLRSLKPEIIVDRPASSGP